MFGEILENLVGDRPAGGVEDLVGAVGQGRRQSLREIVGPMIQAVGAEGVFHISAFFGTGVPITVMPASLPNCTAQLPTAPAAEVTTMVCPGIVRP